jgi:hypothetical protein
MTSNTTPSAEAAPSTPDPIQAAAMECANSIDAFIATYGDDVTAEEFSEIITQTMRELVASEQAEVVRLRKRLVELAYALAVIAEEGGKSVDTECGRIKCDGFWCSEQAKSALRGKLPEIDSAMQREDRK